LAHFRIGRRQASGEVLRVPVRLRLRDRRTPPGDYEAFVESGEEKRRVVLRVLPEPGIRIASNHLEISGAPGQTVEGAFAIESLGNVPAQLPSAFGLLSLEEEGWVCEAWEHARARAGEVPEEGSFHVFMDALVHRLATAQVGTVRVSAADGARSILAGQTAEIRLRFRLPRSLKPGTHYVGTLQVLDQSLEVRLAATAPERGTRD